MQNARNEAAQQVLTLAGEEARKLNHAYIGTEHILLGLLVEGSLASAGALQKLGLTAENLRAEIEKLVERGPQSQTLPDLPLTPRGKRVLDLASEVADSVSLSQVGPEHLLIALLREPDGVAGVALRNLGVSFRALCDTCLEIRKQQMRIVGRAVQPVHAGTRHKRKMREEMLAHLSAIYEEEYDRLKDPPAALDAAAKRFGDPADLARELQASVPVGERIAYQVERWLGWRAPESVLHMMIRTSLISFCIIALGLGIPIVAGIAFQGWDNSQRVALRTLLAMALLTPLAQFGVGICYYKMRDTLFGVFGAHKSRARVALWSALIGLVVMAAGLAFMLIVEGTALRSVDSVVILSWIGVWFSIICLLLVRLRGPAEIRDTVWQVWIWE